MVVTPACGALCAAFKLRFFCCLLLLLLLYDCCMYTRVYNCSSIWPTQPKHPADLRTDRLIYFTFKARAVLVAEARPGRERQPSSITMANRDQGHDEYTIVRIHRIKHKRQARIKQGRTRTPYSMTCLLYTSPSPRDLSTSRMPSSA